MIIQVDSYEIDDKLTYRSYFEVDTADLTCQITDDDDFCHEIVIGEGKDNASSSVVETYAFYTLLGESKAFSVKNSKRFLHETYADSLLYLIDCLLEDEKPESEVLYKLYTNSSVALCPVCDCGHEYDLFECICDVVKKHYKYTVEDFNY